ncbi:MAG TPA: methylmalonyl Co-A mutase-associated GTPase MeaB [Acidimicrobiales bacterium]|nr:methylmalonyl Co-A mutase-associated GTPase MeaB [Acidimicrobiales bacterium]
MSRRKVDVDAYVDGVRAGNRTYLGRAITLVESTNREHQELAQQMLVRLLPFAGDSHRVGITGVPGSGKSTFIDALGTKLTGQGHRVAVLAIDPTSSRTGGSILGDKTRMQRLSVDASAFIRPSPTAGTLGGVTRATRETIIVCEAAGFDVVLVETVGVGQTETLVAKMVDFFLVLMIPGAGDELQGIKKGVLELADMIAVNKADGDNEGRARVAANEYSSALRLVQPSSPTWSPPVVTCSALHEVGLDTLWAQIELHRSKLSASGELDDKRRQQQVDWMWASVEDRLLYRLRHAPGVKRLVPRLEREVRDGTLTATLAAQRVLDALES